MLNTGIIRIDDVRYPENLKNIQDPPDRLYIRGNASLFNTRCVAIAGSRRASREGLMAAELIAGRLAGCGITVVSGLAEGIDAAAHRGALDAGGNTIAVLANGLDQNYPVSNRSLQKEIENKGLLVSEYCDGVVARKHFFPRRNRIISGLSEIVVIAEAALRSGSLITAEAAIEQGREVYAVAGNFMKQCCAGTNHLIADGADYIVDVNQFLSEIGAETETGSGIPEGLSDEEARVYEVIRREGEVSPEQITQATLMPSGMVNGIITVLEIKGVVHMEMGKVFLAVERI